MIAGGAVSTTPRSASTRPGAACGELVFGDGACARARVGADANASASAHAHATCPTPRVVDFPRAIARVRAVRVCDGRAANPSSFPRRGDHDTRDGRRARARKPSWRQIREYLVLFGASTPAAHILGRDRDAGGDERPRGARRRPRAESISARPRGASLDDHASHVHERPVREDERRRHLGDVIVVDVSFRLDAACFVRDGRSTVAVPARALRLGGRGHLRSVPVGLPGRHRGHGLEAPGPTAGLVRAGFLPRGRRRPRREKSRRKNKRAFGVALGARDAPAPRVDRRQKRRGVRGVGRDRIGGGGGSAPNDV